MPDQDWIDRQPSGGWGSGGAGRRLPERRPPALARNASDDIAAMDYRGIERLPRSAQRHIRRLTESLRLTRVALRRALCLVRGYRKQIELDFVGEIEYLAEVCRRLKLVDPEGAQELIAKLGVDPEEMVANGYEIVWELPAGANA